MMRATLVVLLFCFQAAISESWKDADRFFGDVILTEEQERGLFNITGERNAIRNLARRWTDNTIPYEYTDDASERFSDAEKAVINQAIADYSAKTCIKIVPRTNQRNYIKFQKKGGCYSYWGMTGGEQPVSLARGCVRKYIVIHELMHAAGFLHEQSRPDRDTYVTINWNNIQARGKSQFRKMTTDQVRVIGAYDVKSIMHYEEYDFSVDWGRKKVMVAKDGTSPLSNHNGFTDLDVSKIKTLYECDGGATKTCEDVFPSTQCNRWKSTSLQPCTADKYRHYMMDVCAKTCGYCGCFDKHPVICTSWSRAGVCNWKTVYGTWMKKNCAKSCKTCT